MGRRSELKMMKLVLAENKNLFQIMTMMNIWWVPAAAVLEVHGTFAFTEAGHESSGETNL